MTDTEIIRLGEGIMKTGDEGQTMANKKVRETAHITRAQMSIDAIKEF